MPNELATALAVTAMGTTVSVFPSFMPRLEDVRKCPPAEQDMRGDVRLGEVAAVSIALTVGFTLARLSNSTLPLVAATMVSAVVVAVYEYALNTERCLT